MNDLWRLVQDGLFCYPVREGQAPGLLANRCSRCGRTYFPKRQLCSRCIDEGAMENITLDSRGIIYACTVVHIPSPVGIKAPYAYGYVDIPKNQIRVFSLFTGADPSAFRPGQEVELVLEAVRENSNGQRVIGYKFRPISSRP